MLVAGVDIGSTTVKVVLVEDGKPIAHSIRPTGADCNASAEKALMTTLEASGKQREDIKYIVSTGYGRRAISFGHDSVTEITANAKGAVYLGSAAGKIRSIIDIGGQDTKAIILDDNGQIINFVMNDKCAAGTGRFIEVSARYLELAMDDFIKLSAQSTSLVTINSTCIVFAESEIVSLIAKKVPVPDIIAGLHRSIAKRVIDLGRAVGIKQVVFFDGGAAKNVALRAAMEEEYGNRIYVPPEPQIVVALGAAIIAHEKALKKAA